MNLSIIRSLLLSVAAFMVSNCSVVAGNVTVRGTVTNPVSKKICIKPDVFLSEQGCNSAMLDEKGGFLVTFDLKANGYFKFIHGHEYTIMYLEPGYNIDITINPEEFDETISYKGKGAEPNNYLASKYLLVEKLMGDMSEFYELAPLDFIKKNNSIRRATEREFITRCSGSDISDDFRKLERPSLMYNWADMLLKYKMYHEGLTNDDLQAIAPAMKDVYALNREQPELLGARTYRDFLMDLVFDNAAQALKADDGIHANDAVRKWAAINDLFHNREVKEFLFTSVLMQQLAVSVDGLDDLVANFDGYCQNERYKAAVHGELDMWTNLRKGMKAPLFTSEDVSGKAFSLADFKGKYLYIDAWATWCAPCRREIPFMEKLKEEFSDYNIEFIGISLDTDRDAWVKMINEKHMKGTQLHADGGFKSAFATAYNIRSIPRFIIIDPKGDIISANAARPSQGAAEVIKALDGIR